MINLKNITKNIIKKSFPELKDKNLEIYFKYLEDSLMEIDILEQDYNTGIIKVDGTLEKANISVLEGGIAHELCHFSKELSLTDDFKKYDEKIYLNSLKYQIEDEISTDKNVIFRGYGEQLLALAEYRENVLKLPYIEEMGLSINEIKSLLSLKNKTL